MNWQDVANTLATLPPTFTRYGPNFTNWNNSGIAALERFTTSFDDTVAQATFVSAVGNWLNAWGSILGVARRTEYDDLYRICITGVLTAGRGTPVGIEWFMNVARQIPCTVAENFPKVGWQLLLEAGFTLSPTQQAQLPGFLDYVRPAGVPYTITGYNATGVLSTGNFLSATRFPGSWLRTTQGSVPINIPSTTNNTLCLLPTTLFTDPLINPSLSVT
jgi:hypothetical protein